MCISVQIVRFTSICDIQNVLLKKFPQIIFPYVLYIPYEDVFSYCAKSAIGLIYRLIVLMISFIFMLRNSSRSTNSIAYHILRFLILWLRNETKDQKDDLFYLSVWDYDTWTAVCCMLLSCTMFQWCDSEMKSKIKNITRIIWYIFS